MMNSGEIEPAENGLYYKRQYTTRFEMAISADGDREARRVVQVVLNGIDEAVHARGYCASPRDWAATPPFILGWCFNGDFIATNDEGLKRDVPFLDYGKTNGLGVHRYRLEMSVDFEADDDTGARSRIADLVEAMNTGGVDIPDCHCTFSPIDIVGREYGHDRKMLFTEENAVSESPTLDLSR